MLIAILSQHPVAMGVPLLCGANSSPGGAETGPLGKLEKARINNDAGRPVSLPSRNPSASRRHRAVRNSDKCVQEAGDADENGPGYFPDIRSPARLRRPENGGAVDLVFYKLLINIYYFSFATPGETVGKGWPEPRSGEERSRPVVKCADAIPMEAAWRLTIGCGLRRVWK